MSRLRAVAGWAAVLVWMGVDPAWSREIQTEFVPLRPCRAVDSRTNLGTSGVLAPGDIRRITFRQRCGIPDLTNDGGSEVNKATALALNIVAVSPAGVGHLTAWPTNQAMPTASVINYSPGQNVANGVVVPMCDQEVPGADACQTGDISFVAAVSSVHLVVDVTGYYIKPVLSSGTGRHGAGAGFDNFPCINTSSGVRYGLSSEMAPWVNAEALCPAGTWVCSLSEMGSAGCDTSREDNTCDARSCAGACLDQPSDAHRGWVWSVALPRGVAFTASEQFPNNGASTVACEIRPAWCCSRN